MKGLLHTTIGRWLIVAAVAAIAVPAAVQAATAPPQSAIDNASATWAAKAKLLDAYGHPFLAQLPPLSAIDNASATWAAKAKLLDAYGHALPRGTVTPATGSAGFHWGDFGIGLGAMLGLVLLTAGLGTALYASRHRHPRARHA